MPRWPPGLHWQAGSGPGGPGQQALKRVVPTSIFAYGRKVTGVPLQPGQAQTILVGTTSVTAQLWGAGGGGGGNLSTDADFAGGGGGGEFAQQTLIVVPGVTYTVVVGAAGTAGIAGGNGGAGGNSTFTVGATIVTANGGGGGQRGLAAPGTGGAGGTGSTATIHFNGGAGHTGTGVTPSGGGSSAGPASAGNTAAGATGAAAVAGGGPGGNAGGTDSPGLAPVTGPGGGGGSGQGNATNQPGGPGFAGQVVLTWATGSQTFTSSGTFTWTAPGGAGQVTLGPIGVGSVWYPAQATVSTTSGVLDTSTFNLYLGPAGVPITLVGTLFPGGSGTIALAIPPMSPGQYLIGIWTGGHAGDLASLNVLGLMDAVTV